MGDKRKPDPVVADIDVRMVASFFGQLADAIYKAQGGAKVLELKGSDQLAGNNLPIRARRLGELGLVGRKCGHREAPDFWSSLIA